MSNEIYSYLGFPLSDNDYILSNNAEDPFVPTVNCGVNWQGKVKPSMVLTVTGTSGTITWCGKTWSLPGDSGLQQEVCPTAYELQYNPIGGNLNYGLHRWLFQQASTYYSLKLSRFWRSNFSIINNRTNAVSMRDGGVQALNRYKKGTSTAANPISFIPLNGVLLPYSADYLMTDEFFSSYTQSGVTYSWARGTNW